MGGGGQAGVGVYIILELVIVKMHKKVGGGGCPAGGCQGGYELRIIYCENAEKKVGGSGRGRGVR